MIDYVSDVRELAAQNLSDFERRVSDIPPQLYASFYQEARQLDNELLHLYRVVVFFVRKEDDLDSVAFWWGTMVEICDSFLAKLSILRDKHPDCGTDAFHDRMLDLRNKCQRLKTMHA